MELKKNQVRFIEQDLLKRGVHYVPLREDLLDHICTDVEIRMQEGKRFKDAYALALQQFIPQEFSQLQDKTVKNLASFSLIKSYFQTAYRNLIRHKGHTSTNIFGLSVSMSVCILIFVFIRYELSYDKQHPEDNIYRLNTHIKQESGQISSTAFTGAPWGPAMVENIPEILDAARIMKYRLDVMVTNQQTETSYYESDLIWGDQELLSFFDINLTAGNYQTALVQPNSVVISERIANKYFGKKNAIGQVLVYNNEVSLTVTGVMENMPDNMHFKADIICSFSTLNSFWRIIDNWTILYYHTYFKIQKDSNVEAIEAKFPAFFSKRIGKNWTERRSASLQSVKEIHLTSGISDGLKSGTNKQYLYILVIISIVILLLACVNYINLNVARSLKRTKEVGIRKVMGGLKIDLVHQFVLESGMLTFISLITSLILAQLLLPYFNQLLNKQLTIFRSFDGFLIVYLITIMLVVSVLAGIYPALRAASLSTLLALKGKTTTRFGRTIFGNGLMFFQFIICGTLIVAIGIIKLQQQYMLNKDLGYSQQDVLVLSTNNINTDDLELVRSELLSIPDIENVSITSHKLAGDQPYYGRYTFSGSKQSTDTLGLGRLHVDEGFVNTYDLQLLAGRDFNKNIGTDTSSFLINARTAEMLGISPSEALNLTIQYRTQGAHGRYLRTGRIIGVVQNFHLESLHSKIEGIVMDIQPYRAHFIACKLIGSERNELISKIEKSVAPWNESSALDYFYMEDQLGQLYSDEEKLDILISVASMIAIIIAFLGLFGLVSLLTSYKRREIGLRKVLGADVIGITTLLSRPYIYTILSSLLIAFPLSYFWMNNWLQSYPYRIDFPIHWMLITGILLLSVALLTISVLTIKVANSNPINALKEE